MVPISRGWVFAVILGQRSTKLSCQVGLLPYSRCGSPMAEDHREGRRFDADGFSNFFPEDDPELVGEAWKLYDEIRNGEGTR